MADYSNLSGLRDTFRIRTGLVEPGTSGNTRLNSVLNLAVRQLQQDAPTVFKRRELRIILQPQTQTSDASQTLEVNPLDNRSFRVSAGALTSTSQLETELRGRWIDITDGLGRPHQMRILSYGSGNTNTDWGDSAGSRALLYVDRPWQVSLDNPRDFRIYCLDYPLPPDVIDVEDVIWNPETDGSTLLKYVSPVEMDAIRHGSWNESGLPAYWTEGEFHQLRSPHDTPVATVQAAPANTQKWGYTSGGVLDTSYGPPGTFSYRYCLVRGRLRSPTGVLATEAGSRDEMPPFYISAPSDETEHVTTTNGGGMITVASKDEDYLDARKVTAGTTIKNSLAPVSGLEKWWFRARHATTADGASSTTRGENDGIYRLWRITDADTTSIIDRGDKDPVDYNFPLREFNGHKSIRFDVTPTDYLQQVLVRCSVQPQNLEADGDVLPFPQGAATEAVIAQAASYICERDGEFDRAKYYQGLYEFQLNKLRERGGWLSAKGTGFGDGISIGNGRSWSATRRITETT